MKLQIKKIPSCNIDIRTIHEKELMNILYRYKEGWIYQMEWLREPENAKRNNIYI